MLAYIKDILYLCSVNERQQQLSLTIKERKRMKYEVKFNMQKNGGTYRQTFKTYTQAWRYGEILRKRNKPFIINPIND